LKFHQKFERRLKDELDVEPGSKLQELARAVRSRI
jgi:hypothetical protein